MRQSDCLILEENQTLKEIRLPCDNIRTTQSSVEVLPEECSLKRLLFVIRGEDSENVSGSLESLLCLTPCSSRMPTH